MIVMVMTDHNYVNLRRVFQCARWRPKSLWTQKFYGAHPVTPHRIKQNSYAPAFSITNTSDSAVLALFTREVSESRLKWEFKKPARMPNPCRLQHGTMFIPRIIVKAPIRLSHRDKLCNIAGNGDKVPIASESRAEM